MALAVESATRATIIHVAAKYAVATVCGLGFGIAVQVFLFSLVQGSTVGQRDFTVYWVTGQQLAHHANPYDGAALLRLEQAKGLACPRGAMFMRNPPWMLPLVFPLGFMGLWVGSLLWSLTLLACLVVSVHLLWVVQGRPDNRRHFLGYSFAPALICLISGQSSLFALLGLALFLRLYRTWPFLAGVALWLCALKPHLFVPFGVVLLVSAFATKNYRILAGIVCALAISCTIVLCIDPMAFSQYVTMVRTSQIERDFIPCLSYLLRYALLPQAIWIQYVPTVLACCWALYYYRLHQTTWDWRKHGSLLMLVSIMAAPYSWLYDQAVAIPALMQGIYLTRSRNVLIALALGSALVEVALVSTRWKASAVYGWTLWTTPVWLIWYVFATRVSEFKIRTAAVLEAVND